MNEVDDEDAVDDNIAAALDDGLAAIFSVSASADPNAAAVKKRSTRRKTSTSRTKTKTRSETAVSRGEKSSTV